jgi:hypothetical protein
MQMTIVLLLTASVGFLVSVLMLHLGVTRMALRYPAAVLLAYAAFILFLRLWLAWQRRQGRVSDPSPDISFDLPSGGIRAPGKDIDFGGGGGFGGGGAGGSWQGPTPSQQPIAVMQSRSGVAPKGSGKGWDIDLDPGDGAILIVPVAAAIAAVLASLYVIYAAPGLFAELLLDGVVVTALYHRLRNVERRHWLRCVVRKTWLPALLTALVFSVAGHLMQQAVPSAPSIGLFWQTVVNS